MIRAYLKYFKYLVIHKYYVFIECFNNGLYLRAITHDMDKFRPDIFHAYAGYHFYSKDKFEKQYRRAWFHHRFQRHHLFVRSRVTDKDILEALCDWEAMGKVFGDNAKIYYCGNRDDLDIDKETLYKIEEKLNINKARDRKFKTIIPSDRLNKLHRLFKKEYELKTKKTS